MRRRHGRRALDQGLAHVCQILSACLHPTDVVGKLGGADFAVVLLLADRGAALALAVRGRPFHLGGEMSSLDVTWGARLQEPGVGSDAVMEAADRQLVEMARAADAARFRR